MKMLTAKVVRGRIDLPEDLLEEGSTVTVLIPEGEERSSRFPAFEVPAGTRMIPASRIQKALDEDGIV